MKFRAGLSLFRPNIINLNNCRLWKTLILLLHWRECNLFFLFLDSPYRTKLSTAILKLQSSGVIEKIRKKWWEERKGGGQCTVSLNVFNYIWVWPKRLITVFALLSGCRWRYWSHSTRPPERRRYILRDNLRYHPRRGNSYIRVRLQHLENQQESENTLPGSVQAGTQVLLQVRQQRQTGPGRIRRRWKIGKISNEIAERPIQIQVREIQDYDD